jgi:hypothetical protein
MQIQFLDGTISYHEGCPPQLPCNYQLEALFSEDVGPDLHVRDLEALQERFGFDLIVSRANDGSLHIRREIVAHGPESAFWQAEDLSRAMNDQLGLVTNITHARPVPRA